MFSLQQIISRRAEIHTDRNERQVLHDTFLKSSASELAKLAEAETLIVGGLDVQRIERARQIIAIHGRVTDVRRASDYMRAGDQSGVRANALNEAKEDMAAGGIKIAVRYFGVKNYDAFGDQRNDSEYGMGPRHGSIVFSIGLTQGAREQIKSGQPLLDEQIDAALYLLSALPKIEQLQTEAQKVAA